MKEETRDVNLFLKKDFWHYINLGGINYNQLSSPQLTFTPNTHRVILMELKNAS
ncbi:hypothetical protein [uncultured Lactobacillus sp.]|uniref:hypothetical protein n=1 Tax=uncultured Lactobacillus sp. TaxID=153152 RepID=UPI00258F9B3A|nr:hypothetical protein [uncultured Lactobacillus sp.]